MKPNLWKKKVRITTCAWLKVCSFCKKKDIAPDVFLRLGFFILKMICIIEVIKTKSFYVEY